MIQVHFSRYFMGEKCCRHQDSSTGPSDPASNDIKHNNHLYNFSSMSLWDWSLFLTLVATNLGAIARNSIWPELEWTQSVYTQLEFPQMADELPLQSPDWKKKFEGIFKLNVASPLTTSGFKWFPISDTRADKIEPLVEYFRLTTLAAWIIKEQIYLIIGNALAWLERN